LFGQTGNGPVVNKMFELTAQRRDGTEFPVELSLSAMNVNGEWHATGIIRDITERKEAETERLAGAKRLEQSLLQTIEAIGALVEARDPYTAGHQRRVAVLARAIAQEMGLSDDKIYGLYWAATIHDLGKISIPAEILSKPSKLRPIEFELIKTHAQNGYDIIKDAQFPWPLAQMVLQHHERLDGSGYPQALSGDQILIEAKILAVADVVEAMSSHRPYRPSLGLDAALEEIAAQRGVLYDPAVVDCCLKLFREKNYDFQANATP
jgi:HD-GYP domain-containing protein (c-di-GMP phosphodiesterase class II)